MPSTPPSPTMRAIRWIPAVAALLFVALAVPGLRSNTATCDELGAHIPAGILAWRTGGASGGLANPPLGQRLIGAGPIWSGTADRPLDDAPRHVLPARLPIVGLGVATLLLSAALAGRAAGPGAAGFASLVAALCPNLLAHSELATLDVPVTALTAAACAAAWAHARTGKTIHLAVCALSVGAAAATKFTGLHLLPALALAACLDGGSVRERIRRSGTLLAACVGGTWAVAWLAYGIGPERFGLPEAMVAGIAQKWAHGSTGHWAYLAGRVSHEGFAAYFLVALAVKVPLAISFACACGVLALARSRRATTHASGHSDARGFGAYVVTPAVWIFVAMSLVHRVDVGIRHILPAFPALLATAGIGLAYLARRDRIGQTLALASLVWLLVAAIRISPDPLAYFHELAGGPTGGDRILVDSNLDWGQDDARLHRWIADDAVAINPPRPVSGVVVANVNALHGILSRDDRRLRWLTALPVSHRIGNCWRAYVVDEAPLREAAKRSPMRALDYARWLEGVGRPADALEVLAASDLSRHERHAGEWFSLRAEAHLASGDLRRAADDVARVDDPDLALLLAYRAAEVAGASPETWSPSLRTGIVGALARRDHWNEANDVCRRLTGRTLEELDEPGSLARAIRWRVLGREREALAIVGEVLAREPTNDDALWLYGELVVRRKLGLTNYELPDVDWSGLSRRDGGP